MPNSYPRDDALGLLDAPHLRRVQNEGGLALDLLAEAVRVQHLVDIRVRTRRGGMGHIVSVFNDLKTLFCSR